MNTSIDAEDEEQAVQPVGVRIAIAAFAQEEDGVTAIEYALLAALIAMAIVGSVSALGTTVQEMWLAVANAVDAAIP